MRAPRLAVHFPALLAGLLGISWLGAHGYFSVLAPTEVRWLGVSDWAQHYLGWAFYRDDAWHWPLGHVSTLPYPIGTNIAFTDSMPWLAAFFKFWSPFLPRPFQYVGLWLFTCFFLQGFIGAKLVKRFDTRGWVQAMGGTVFVLAPVLMFRLSHEALCGMAALLFVLWLYFAPVTTRADTRTPFLLSLLTIAVCIGIHPTLAAMVTALCTSLLFKWRWADKLISTRQLAGGFAAQAAAFIVPALFIGSVGSGVNRSAEGFGYFSADLFAFVNPLGWSRLLPTLPLRHSEQYEGFGYLGLGGIALLVTAAELARRHRAEVTRSRLVQLAPIAAVAGLLAFFALSSEITALGHTLLTAKGFYRLFAPLTGAFRSSGRFIWPLYFVLLTVGLAVTVKLLARKPRQLAGVLGTVVLLQLIDVDTSQAREKLTALVAVAPNAPAWRLAQGDYQHLALVPPLLSSTDDWCERRGEPDEYQPYAMLAAELRMTVNSMYLARADTAALHEHCHFKTLPEKPLDDTVYVVTEKKAMEGASGAYTCGTLNGMSVCVASARPTRFQTALLGR